MKEAMSEVWKRLPEKMRVVAGPKAGPKVHGIILRHGTDDNGIYTEVRLDIGRDVAFHPDQVDACSTLVNVIQFPRPNGWCFYCQKPVRWPEDAEGAPVCASCKASH